MTGEKATYIIDLQGNFPQRLRQYSKHVDDFENKLKGTQKKVDGTFGGIGESLKAAGIVVALGLVARAAWNTGKYLSGLAAQFEQTRISYQVMAGSVQKGNKLLAEVKEYANVTPYEFKDVSEAGKLLLNYGVSANKVLPSLKMLGDVAAGDADRLKSIALAYGQINATGRLTGQDLLQLVNNGFNPLKIISEKTGISMGVLKKKMEDGAISAENVAKAFKIATSEGGLFYKMTEKQGQTFGGKMSTLNDKLTTTFEGLGSTLNSALLPVLDKINAKLDEIADPQRFKVDQFEKEMSRRGNLAGYLDQMIDYKNMPKIGPDGKPSAASKMVRDLEKQLLEEYPEFAKGFKDGKPTGLNAQKLQGYLKAGAGSNRETLRKYLDDEIRKQQDRVSIGDEILAQTSNNPDSWGQLGAGQAEQEKQLTRLKDLMKMRQGLDKPRRGQGLLSSGMAANDTFTFAPGKGKDKDKDKIDGEIRSGGVKNITINITQLVGEINFENFEVSEGKAVEIVKRALVTAVNDANNAVQ